MPRLSFIRLLVAAAAVACALVAPAGASAFTSAGEPVADAQVDRWLGVAQAAWGAAPGCPDGVRVDRAERLAGASVWAAAEMPGCRISLDPDSYPAPADWTATAAGRSRWEEQMCNVIAHEWGHLLGHDHSSDRGHLMAAVVPLTVVACRTPAAAPARTAAKAKKAAKRSRRSSGGARRRR